MEKTSLLLIVVGAALLAASPAMAEVRSGTFTVSPFVGGYTFDGVEHLHTNVTGGLRLGYNINRNWGVEGQLGYVPVESTMGPGSSTSSFYNARLDVLYHFMPERRLVPFLALGGGYSRLEFNANNDITADYGFGALYNISDNIALRGDLRQIFSFYGSEKRGGNWYWQNFEYTVGVSYQFGGRQYAAKVVEAPAPEPMPVEKAVPPPAPAPAPVAEPEPVQATSWQGESKTAQAGTVLVSGMKVEDNVLEFTANESIRNYKVLTLSQPSRLVIDVANGINGLGTEKILVDKLGITTVRFESTPEYLRIILDAAEGRLIPYRIEETATGLKVIVTTP